MVVEPTTLPPPVETSVDRFEHDMEELEEKTGHFKWGRWAFIVVAIVGVMAAVYFMGNGAPPPPVSRVQQAPLLELDQPHGGKLSSTPRQFSWESVQGRDFYAFKVMRRNEETPIIERTSKERTVALTAEEAALMTAGGRYTWQVEARTKQGKVLAAGRLNFEL
jgi:hypothetical protein